MTPRSTKTAVTVLLTVAFSIIATGKVTTAFTGYHPSFSFISSRGTSSSDTHPTAKNVLITSSSSSLLMAGFGSGSGSSASSKKKGGSNKLLPKLKPKTQWDRFTDLKSATRVKVGVRVVVNDNENEEQTNEWLEVGEVKSENDEYTEIAVARQRALIAEHAKRIHPLKVLPKDRVEWGYYKGEEDAGEWVLVNKDVGNNAPNGIEKKMGFEGTPDPATGYYCHYSSGRLVDKPGDKSFKAT